MVTTVLTVAQNTFVSSAQPNENFSIYPLLYTGSDKIFETCISLLKFDFTTIPTNAVDSAFLELSAIVKSEETPSTIVVNRVTGNFDSYHVTYATMPVIAVTQSEIQITQEELYKTVQIDITDLVNSWLGGVNVNYGLALTSSAPATLVQFGSDRIVWEPYFPKLVLDYSTVPAETSKSYEYIYHTGNQCIDIAKNVPFNYKGIMKGMFNATESDSVTIEEAGSYAVWFSVDGSFRNQFALFKNDVLAQGSIYTPGSLTVAANTNMTIISAASGDQLTLRSDKSLRSVLLSHQVGDIEENITASILAMKVGPAEAPVPPLTAINQSQTDAEMRAAINTPDLGLDLTDFIGVSAVRQEKVLTELRAKRPLSGYPDAASIQAVLITAVEFSVDPAQIYVDSSVTEGVGNSEHPLRTIEEAIAVVDPGGTLHIRGSFDVSNTINIAKEGITLLGVSNPEFIVGSDSVPLIVTAPNVSLNGITVTNTAYRPSELVRIISSNVKVTNCNLIGRGKPTLNQLMDGITTVEESAGSYSIENNRLSSLGSAIRLLDSPNGVVIANNISDSAVGITIDCGIASISENTCLGLPNDTDILITARTPAGPTYDNTEELSLANSEAVVMDLWAQ